jgi:HPt (histidine-containing phosphotransfer) domain-containing protein
MVVKTEAGQNANRLKDILTPIMDGLEVEQEFQRSLNVMFLKNNTKKFREITKALNEGDIKLAHRLVHTLKGNSGQLGKIPLQQAAQTVERQLKDEENLVTEEQLRTLEIELNAVLSHMATEFPEQLDDYPSIAGNPESNEEWLDEKSMLELIEKLELQLKMGSPDCQQFIGAFRLIPGNEELKAQLIQQMDDFDFDGAMVSLAELKKNCGIK